MYNPMGNILRKATKKSSEKLNVLEWVVHERAQSSIAATGHNFFIAQIDHPNFKKYWNNNYAKLPDNFTLLPMVTGNSVEELVNNIIKVIPRHLSIDLVMSHHKFGMWQVANPLSKILHCGLVQLEHTCPMPYWHPSQIQQCKQMLGDINLFITEQSMKAWGFEENEGYVVRHGLDVNVFKEDLNVEKKPIVLNIANDFINRNIPLGWELFQEVSKGLPVRVRGDTPGLSTPTTSVAELVNEYREASVFLNTTQHSPLPTVILESLSVSVPVVSSNNYAISEVVEHGVNGFLSNNPNELREYCKLLLNNKELREKMGKAGRKTVVEKYNLVDHVKTWDEILTKTSEIPYI